MAKREKKIVLQGVTGEEMEDAFTAYAMADAKLQKVNAIMDVKITEVREKYADEIAKLNEIRDRNFETLQAWSIENKDELFTKKKSMDHAHGVIGFRTGTPKLKALKGFTWGAVTNLLKEFLPAYVRVTEEPAKDKLLADRDNEDTASQFSKCGISVIQDETFFVELKKEEVPA